ncbi:MAG: hypothetical protein KDK24_13970 [Pseudooceanicola sp.]|nr:hypothetical protein [Pseudooceanicola sp.]
MLFDRNFDLEVEQERAERRRLAEAVFTASELAEAVAEARRDAFEDGRQAGKAEATEALKESDLRRQAETLAELSGQVGELTAAIDERIAGLEQQLLSFVLAVFEKVAPEVLASRAGPRAEAEVRSAIAMARGTSVLHLYLPPAVHAAIGETLAAVSLVGEGRVAINADPALREGDARVEWDNGFMEYSFATICDRILTGLRAAAGKPDQGGKDNG